MYKLPGLGTLSGRSTSAFSTLKTMALAPIASARVSTAVRANPGALRNCRKASRRVALMRPSFELWGSSYRVNSGYTFFTHQRELRFRLILLGIRNLPPLVYRDTSPSRIETVRIRTAVSREQPSIHQGATLSAI